MEASAVVALTQHFPSLEDPRVERPRLHPLLSIVVIAICAVLSGAESWDDIAEFGEAKAEWFGTFLELPHGIPAHDTFNRVFAALDPGQFRAGFLAWMQAVATVLPTEVIALAGKTVRRSHDRAAGRGPIHLVSAWAASNRLVLAQVKVAAKSNEVTAVPHVLQQLAVAGCSVTIDAMGCQRTIAQQIVAQGGDYVLALKGNQGAWQADVVATFAQVAADGWPPGGSDYAETLDKGHGRLEHRHHWVLHAPSLLAWLQGAHPWPGLQAIGLVEATRRIGATHSVEQRYYLLSAPLSAQAFGAAVRGHWGIENQVHWVLDVVFHEDTSRIRQGVAAENFGVLRHLALNLLRQAPHRRLSLKARRLKAGWDTDYLLRVLQAHLMRWP